MPTVGTSYSPGEEGEEKTQAHIGNTVNVVTVEDLTRGRVLEVMRTLSSIR